MLNRKGFIKQAGLATASLLAGPQLLNAAAGWDTQKLTILHTNDTHSRLDPFPMDGGAYQGLGGVAARSRLISNIRKEAEHVLLLDAGDIFQGTPYFNLFQGEPEIRAMSAMGYDATAIGNHDFDAGMENLATQLRRHARFPMLVCNYDFSGTPMEFQTQPYLVVKKGKLRIGILGVGIEGKGLIPENLFGATQYLDPVMMANRVAYDLRKNKKCDFIICLSHLGFRYSEPTIVSDDILAKESEEIDLIIGGHTHTFMDAPVWISNKKGRDVLVNQVGWSGIVLGRLDFEFSKFSGKKLSNFSTISVLEKTVDKNFFLEKNW